MWLEIIKNIINIFFNLKDVSDKKKQKISQLFMDISLLLDATVKDLQNDIYPHGNCQAMKSLSEELVNILKGKIADDRLKQLDEQLKLASNLELEFVRRKDIETIIALKKTAGQFHALSLIYKL